jgi:hypothetical protein
MCHSRVHFDVHTTGACQYCSSAVHNVLTLGLGSVPMKHEAVPIHSFVSFGAGAGVGGSLAGADETTQ